MVKFMLLVAVAFGVGLCVGIYFGFQVCKHMMIAKIYRDITSADNDF